MATPRSGGGELEKTRTCHPRHSQTRFASFARVETLRVARAARGERVFRFSLTKLILSYSYYAYVPGKNRLPLRRNTREYPGRNMMPCDVQFLKHPQHFRRPCTRNLPENSFISIHQRCEGAISRRFLIDTIIH